MENQTYTMNATRFKELFPETKLPSTYTGDIKINDNATVSTSSGSETIFNFSERNIDPTNNQINFPNLTTLEESPYPNKYYWDGKSFQYNLIGINGSDFLISCNFDIDPRCFFIWRGDPHNPGGMTESTQKVESIAVFDEANNIYKISISSPTDPSEWELSVSSFKHSVCIEKVRVPFKNTFVCSGLELDTVLFERKKRSITYIANPYNDMAFAKRDNIETVIVGTLDIIEDNQKYYIPDKYRNVENQYLYFKPDGSITNGYLELR